MSRAGSSRRARGGCWPWARRNRRGRYWRRAPGRTAGCWTASLRRRWTSCRRQRPAPRTATATRATCSTCSGRRTCGRRRWPCSSTGPCAACASTGWPSTWARSAATYSWTSRRPGSSNCPARSCASTWWRSSAAGTRYCPPTWSRPWRAYSSRSCRRVRVRVVAFRVRDAETENRFRRNRPRFSWNRPRRLGKYLTFYWYMSTRF